MPYIHHSRRNELVNTTQQINYEVKGNPGVTPGDLNYLITNMMLDYIDNKGESYQTYNDLIGVLECAKMELYRRQVSHYEEKKIKENGDI